MQITRGGYRMTRDIEVYTHSSIRLTERDRKIYIDPFQMRRENKDADFILITHDHYDHFSPEDIARVAGPSTVLVVPETMADKAKSIAPLVSRIETVRPGQIYNIDGLALETVAAYNIGKSFHPKDAGWVGYIVMIPGQRVYIAGDTDETAEALNVICDVAMVPIGGTYTMDARQAAQLVNHIRPKVAIPVHYGGHVGKKTDAQIFRDHVDPSISVEVKMLY